MCLVTRAGSAGAKEQLDHPGVSKMGGQEGEASSLSSLLR